ncbi:MAG: nicotinate (nicotinamide) nucleotide adenylyltransferase [Phycisphaeraceae bacterium]
MPSDLTGYRSVLVFGGSFDPPHRAHVLLPQQAAKAIGADVIAYIPAGRAPHKLDKVQTAPDHRLAMLRLALADHPGGIPALVVTDEIDRGPDQPSYTVDTLERLRANLDPGASMRLLIGADQLRIFDQWRSPERIVALAEPLVMVRPPDTRESLLAGLPADERDAWAKRLVDTESMDLSSTEVREAGGRSEMICDAVAEYIDSHDLYRDA